jgi:hypothetical protein
MQQGTASQPSPELTLTCRCSKKYCSRQALRSTARVRSWPLGDLIHGLRCYRRGGFTQVAAWEASQEDEPIP